MSNQRASRPVSGSAEIAIRFAASATSAVWRSKILLLGALAALLVLAAVPILSQADVPSAAATGTLTCYDSVGMPISCRADSLPVAASGVLKCYSSAGNYQPCLARADLSPSRTTAADQPEGGPASGQYQQTNAATTAPDRQVSEPYHLASGATAAPPQRPTPVTGAPDQQASSTPTAVVQPANWTTTVPPVRLSNVLGKRRAAARCRRHSLTCFFSALRRGVTHLASVAATMGRPPGREHL